METGVSIEQIWCAGHTTVFTVKRNTQDVLIPVTRNTHNFLTNTREHTRYHHTSNTQEKHTKPSHTN